MKQEYFTITDNHTLKTSEIMQKLRDKFSVYSYWDDAELDKEFPAPKEITTRYFKKNVEPDEDLRLSYNEMERRGIKNITFRERLLMELAYFEETGKHLDVIGWTRTSSRGSDGRVALALWSGADGEFYADWSNPGNDNRNGGGRVGAVSLPTFDSFPSLEEAVKIVKAAGYKVIQEL